MLPLTATAILAGQLLSTACAAGLNLYATVALIGFASRVGWIAPLPPDLRGLSHAVVIGSAAALFLAELVIEKLPIVGAVWAGAHTIIRPLAAVLLTFLAFAQQPLDVALPLAAAAGVVAFAAHGVKTGVRVWLAGGRRRRSAIYAAAATTALDLVAIALAFAALLHPTAALGIGIGALVIILAVGPRLWRASTFGARALFARLVGFFGRPGWTRRARLPRLLRRAVPTAPLGLGEPMGTRAAALGLRGAGAYRNGWLVFAHDGVSFVFLSLLGPRSIRLPPIRSLELRPGAITDALRATAADQNFTLFLLKDGPATDTTVAELNRWHEPS